MKLRRSLIFCYAASRHTSSAIVIYCCLQGFSTLKAGDILRSGTGAGGSTVVSNPIGNVPPPLVPTAPTASDTLSRTTNAIQVAQAAQAAARAIAVSGANHVATPHASGAALPDVANGLKKGGLTVDSRVSSQSSMWSGADLPIESNASASEVSVVIKQTAQQALLNWETMNVGKNTTLKFDQSAGKSASGQWIAFNKVNDPSRNPTQILGTIQAEGQVYVINPNGIIFGGSSRVNAHALVATSLPVNANLINRGLLNNPDQQFLFTAIKQAPGAETAAFDPELDVNTRVGDVIVEKGAILEAPTNSEKVGGRIALIGANVVNSGSISTADGQTILAAGLQVGVDAHQSSDPALRGLDVYVGAVTADGSSLAPYAGSVLNDGYIEAARANVTMAGKSVTQDGVIRSSTSVSLNGRVDLSAQYDAVKNIAYSNVSPSIIEPKFYLHQKTGVLTLGQGSVIEIMPEVASAEKVIGTKLSLSSTINLLGQRIHMDDGAMILAPSGNVSLRAGSWLTLPSSSSTSPPTYTFTRQNGRIDIDSSARIDVSGLKNVQSSVTSNIVEAQLRGSELADFPLQRDGALRGSSVYIDITQTGVYDGRTWVGSPIADVSGYVNLVQRNVAELSATGGTVSLTAGDSVALREGSLIDVSGGTIDYVGGYVKTTRVVAQGNVYDISQATPDLEYQGIYGGRSTFNNRKWSTKISYTHSLAPTGQRYQEGFIQGGNGGKLVVAAASMALDGTTNANVYVGVRQRDIAPSSSLLDLSFTKERLINALPSAYNSTSPTIAFLPVKQQALVADFALDGNGEPVALAQDRIERFQLDPKILSDSQFGSLSIYNPDGDIILPQGVQLRAATGGSVVLSGSSLEIDGQIVANSGSVSLNAYQVSPALEAVLRGSASVTLPTVDASRGNVNIGASAVISTAGFLVDDRAGSPLALSKPNAITGGTIAIRGFQVQVSEGSLLDVSGGAKSDERARVTYGAAGTLSLLAGRDLSLTGLTGGGLHLGGEWRGFSGGKGGTLNLQSTLVEIGDHVQNPQALHLDSAFFDRGGFTTFSVNGLGSISGAGTEPGLVLLSDALIKPTVLSWQVAEIQDRTDLMLSTFLKPQGLRSAVSLSFSALGATNNLNSQLLHLGELRVEENSVVDAGPGGSIALRGDNVEMNGRLRALGGSVSITGASRLPSTAALTTAYSTVVLGQSADVDVSGGLVLSPDAYGRRRGKVWDGGSIRVSGNIMAQNGARLVANGAAETLDLLPGEASQDLLLRESNRNGLTATPYAWVSTPVTVESNAGTITLAGGEFVRSDATLQARAGGETAAGGTLKLSSNRFYLNGEVAKPDDVTVVLRQSSDVLSDHQAHELREAVADDVSGFTGGALVSVDRIASAGFTNVEFSGVLRAEGDVSINLPGRLVMGSGPTFSSDGLVQLNAAYVAMGAPFAKPVLPSASKDIYSVDGSVYRMPPTHGSGQLSVSANWIDVGDCSLRGIGRVTLDANHGDLRGSGTLAVAGDLTLRAAQVYAPTAMQWTVAAFDYTTGGTGKTGSVTVESSAEKSLPLSAGSTLSIQASQIVQSGHLRAPFGTIILGSDGNESNENDVLTGLDFVKTQRVVLAADSVTSVSAIDPITGKGVIIPFGKSSDGSTWIDPRGVDISASGVPQKSVTMVADQLVSESGSSVDIRGGGDLRAYRWVSGLGGSVDLLASTNSFAILPAYGAGVAPYAPFNDASSATGLGGDLGYVNSALQLGDQFYWEGGGGLAKGTYVLLPARYATLDGAFLVTPRADANAGVQKKADGTYVGSGYRWSGMDTERQMGALLGRYELASGSVLIKKAEYTKFSANAFFKALSGYRLPGDAGQLVLTASGKMDLHGSVSSLGQSGFRGGLIDINSPVEILIGTTASTPAANVLLLDSALLSGFNAESLLIGGRRVTDASGSWIDVGSPKVTVDNQGSAWSGQELIVVAKSELNIAAGAEINSNGVKKATDETLVVGNSSVVGSGDGALVALSNQSQLRVERRGLSSATSARLTVGSAVSLAAESLVLDSSAVNALSASADLQSNSLALGSGRITVSFDAAQILGADAGLVLSGQTLADLSRASNLTLSSYSSIDFIGTGQLGSVLAPLKDLTLNAVSLRSVGTVPSQIGVHADHILLTNRTDISIGAQPVIDGSTLILSAKELDLGVGNVAVDGFKSVQLAASQQLRAIEHGQLNVAGSLDVATPLMTAAAKIDYAIESRGALVTTGGNATAAALATAGLGGALSLTGGSVSIGSQLYLPSGKLELRATTGDLTIDDLLQVKGSSQKFRSATKYTDAGSIALKSDLGNVVETANGVIDISAAAAGGNAGAVSFSAINGQLQISGSLRAQAGASGLAGSAAFDLSTLSDTRSVNEFLSSAALSREVSFRVRHGDVQWNGSLPSRRYEMVVENGSLGVSGQIDASGKTGGSIRLVASHGLVLENTATLSVRGDEFNSAGQGGAIELETRGADGNGLNLKAGALLDLSVDAQTTQSASMGQFSGVLSLRAPQTSANDNVLLQDLNATVKNASHVAIEGYRTYDRSAANGELNAALLSNISADAASFVANADSIKSRVLTSNAALSSITSVRPGVEIVNASGNLTLGTATTTSTSDWNLSSMRYGAQKVPGVLTLRAAGDIILFNSISDGFESSAYNAALSQRNDLLPENVQSWNYCFVAGADFGSIDRKSVAAITTLPSDLGSIKLGKNAFTASITGGSAAKLSAALMSQRFQTIRTGGGSISIHAGRDVQLLNQFATIYTAGVQVADATMGGTFAVPTPRIISDTESGAALGSVQQTTPAPVQYTMGGGSVTVQAGNDIIHLTRNSQLKLIADSQRQMPTNWLYRRGAVDQSGNFANSKFGEKASTTWWVDFTNFFEGVGALGGGNVTLSAGRDVSNVDAVAPTNARMPGNVVDANALLELGGGDVSVTAGRNVDGGVYYVERGRGLIDAGASVTTNATRSMSLTNLTIPNRYNDSSTWLATTLFVGKSQFELKATEDLLLGPVANVFLMPQGYNNTFWYKTWFSTYSSDAAVTLSSLAGDVTLRQGVSMPSSSAAPTIPSLQAWYQSQLLLGTASSAFYHPWLRLSETNVSAFSTAFQMMPGTLSASAFSGSIRMVGGLTLAPSAMGQLELMAAQSVHGTQISGVATIDGKVTNVWSPSQVNLSDANPNSIYGVASPFAYQSYGSVGFLTSRANKSSSDFLNTLNMLFDETGSTSGVLQEKQSRHDSSGLHRLDPNPLRIFAEQGDITGFTLFSGKKSQILAGQDLRDVSFYVQHLHASDQSVVAAARDIIAYDANSPDRVLAAAEGNVAVSASLAPAGDLQIAGPGRLLVIAGRNLDLGLGANQSDGTGTGITSIGNARNPYLDFAGADISALAGLGDAVSVSASALNFTAFRKDFIETTEGQVLLDELGYTLTSFSSLEEEQQKHVAVQLFFLVLRDAGRNHNNPDSPYYGTYEQGKKAVAALFPGSTWKGDITTRSRDIRTKNGGDITLLSPGGGLALASSTIGNPLAPPGIVTESGGQINVFTDQNVELGISRIFTLRGGDEIIWSSKGNIAAGSSSKTVQAAPPTRVLVDPQSADIKIDLAGLATGGGIGVLTSVAGVEPSDVDLIAPEGSIDAGDAGIRVSGNLNIAAAVVVNAGNISAAGSSTGASAPAVSAPSVSAVSTASNSTAKTDTISSQADRQQQAPVQQELALDSLIAVEIIGYGGGESFSDEIGGSSDEDQDKEKDKDKAEPKTEGGAAQ